MNKCFIFICFYLQEGDVIELCQVSDIRAGGLPKVIAVSIFFLFLLKEILVKASTSFSLILKSNFEEFIYFIWTRQ